MERRMEIIMNRQQAVILLREYKLEYERLNPLFTFHLDDAESCLYQIEQGRRIMLMGIAINPPVKNEYVILVSE